MAKNKSRKKVIGVGMLPDASTKPLQRLAALLGWPAAPWKLQTALAHAVVVALSLVDREFDQEITVSTAALHELMERRTRANTAHAVAAILRSLTREKVRATVDGEEVVVDVLTKDGTSRFRLGENQMRRIDYPPQHVQDIIEA